MKTSKWYIVCLMIILTARMTAQDLSIHRWEHRLLLIIATGADDAGYQKQIAMLKDNETGLNDRKLIVYQIVPQAYQKGVMGINRWTTSKKLYNDYSNKKDQFELILIGLDGEIKLRQASILSIEKLFGTIDNMPMRSSELKPKD